ncbi:hypothetical protein AWM75_02650 [Aerococcus urinaehominis]|uniref:Chromosome partition protein Smc n=1 Tax=Aerococcus urinaehominis TaxID=128944 RepID=A0A0X8FLR7_9LACT|nr:chromosome segregation protein SMC [Aerococcus urinaehominis]AMB98962.1 hypothetical protein AWM75_02650 [Aerococcus urinaehominis]SDM36945.1 condensin subunit Smc [Aerococcus urinaehominis]
MYLKAIDMVGFKSFANKTHIELNPGFTAIVGPNGSGKSNITEAIKWVLGEQSAKSLRGRRMDDVIFAGASERRPSQYAQVTLVFDNSDRVLAIDQDEVSISRRFTRSGESTYQINQQNCRLRDITDLTMDTGVGRDSFSIISQGRVEEIFSQKPGDRRGIIEEAAGVLKYKTRKYEAEKKLRATEDDLSRLYDIVHGLSQRLAPLADQREAALKYQTMKEELSQLDIALTTVQVETLSDQWAVTKQDLEQLNDRIDQNQDQASQLQAQIKAGKDRYQDLDQLVNQDNQAYVAGVQKIEQLRSELKVLDQQARFRKQSKASQDQVLAELRGAIKTGTDDVAQVQADLAVIDQAQADLADQIKQVQADLDHLQPVTDQEIEAERERYINLRQDLVHLRNRLAQNKKDQDQEKAQSQRLDRTSNQDQAAIDKLDQTKLTQTKELDQVQAHLAELLDRYRQQARLYQDRQSDLKQLDQGRQQANQHMLRTESRLHSLKELAADHTGFYQGPKAALALKSQHPGIKGAVAQLIQVPAKYLVASEIALASASQNIVVDTSQTASQVIKQLKKDQTGRATFYPLDTIKGRYLHKSVGEAAQLAPGYCGVLAELLDYDQVYREIIYNLLGQTLVFTDLDQGRHFARSQGNRVRIVTLEGDLIHPGGSMTGGSVKKQARGLLGRQHEIDQLQAQLDQEKDRYHQAQASYQQLADQVKDQEAQLAKLKEQGDETRYQERRLKDRLDQTSQQLADRKKEAAAQGYEHQVNQENLLQLSQEAEELQAQLAKKEAELEESQARLKTYNQSAEESRQAKDQLQAQLQELKTERAVVVERQAQQQKELSQSQADLDSRQDRLATILADLDQINDDQTADQTKQAQLAIDLKAAENWRQDMDQQLKQAQADRQNQAQKNNDLQVALDQVTASLQDYYQQQSKLEARSSRFEVTIDNHLTQLNEDYGLTFERAKAQSHLDMSIEAASQRVGDLKRQLSQLGPVNLAAIDEYDQVNDQYQFTEGQRQDILKAKADLEATMAKMDQEVSRRFKQTFKVVQANFQKIFPKLFGGGQADLILTDPSDLLHTGIEIKAQPPGKKLQHLSLLSGGEKALTAIALLFAILEANTVAFSILDEVEAALDEANVARYGQYLKNFKGSTQFIVITHRKGTMAEADLLYGVTMQKDGVSQLAAVRLEEYDDLEE